MYFFKKARAIIVTVLACMVLPYTVAGAASYTVSQGDSLYLIGKRYDTTVSAIKKANNLSGDLIYPGQILVIPSSVYTVKSGDTLYLIAKRNGITLNSLRTANNKWDDTIYPGQVLKLPEGTSSGNNVTVSSYSGVIPYSSGELDLLARLITAEAESEPYSAKVAVGAVVVNRVKDPRFPNSINDVIYEKSYGYYQFTPVENGWIYKPASESSKKAANEVLKGSDPSNGAVYYFDDSTTNKWLWSKPIKARIGRMVYVY